MNSSLVNIQSNQFNNVFLRMDGSGVTQPTGPGGGIVNCQYNASTYEKFKIVKNSDDTFSIESNQFPGIFLRMDGRGVTQPIGPGGGVVNCQFGARSYEKFNLIKNSDGTFSIESDQFPGVFLRMDGSSITQPSAPGGGVVNCQFNARTSEKFHIRLFDKKNVTITLKVDAVSLYNGTKTIDESCKITDPVSFIDDIPENHLSQVFKNMSVTWTGENTSTESGYSISIDEIDHESGVEIFGQNKLTGSGGIVSGTVLANANTDAIDVYSILFTINGPNGPLQFPIDPKLSINN